MTYVRYSGNPGMEVNDGPRHCYQPCETGLHVVGQHPDGVNCYTVANLTMRNPDAARGLWEAARVAYEVAEGEPHDLVVDLMQNTHHTDDFLMTRQMLARLLRDIVGDLPTNPDLPETGEGENP